MIFKQYKQNIRTYYTLKRSPATSSFTLEMKERLECFKKVMKDERNLRYPFKAKRIQKGFFL